MYVNSASVAVVAMTLALTSAAVAGGRGVEIRPDENGQFEYADDFATSKFARDAFLTNLPIECWTKGSIATTGPNRNRTLTYRFRGKRLIEAVDVGAEQRANARHLGGYNTLHLSTNGLDWTPHDSSRDQNADANGWQTGPLTAGAKQAGYLLGRTEIWVRIVLDNNCGLPTNTSNQITRLAVKLKAGAPASAAADPQAELRSAWGDIRKRAGWRSIALDWADPVDRRPTHYYEDSDGWLQVAGENPHLAPDESAGFPIRRGHLDKTRSPIALAVFVKTAGDEAPPLARITVQATKDSSRKMNVSWDGAVSATFDVAEYFERQRTFLVRLLGAPTAGVHELRIAGADGGKIDVRQIVLAGPGAPEWAEKPKLPAGGSLEVLSAYYMPDPKPPADSQVVEGRQKKQEVGMIFKGMQSLYKQHAEFGGVRVVFRNNGQAPVRVADRLGVNGKSVEDRYVDFKNSQWDARGVVWHRVRPRLVKPGQCAQLYIRFRRRPEGDTTRLRVNLENGKPFDVAIPHADPGVSIDHVTLGKDGTTLYLYARRKPNSAAGRVHAATFDGRPLVDAKIHGPDFPGSVALVVAKLPNKPEPLSYHVVGIKTAGGRSVAAQFRVLPFVYPRSSIHAPDDRCKEMHMNLAMWHERSLETCRKYDLRTTTTAIFDRHERVAFVLGPDEPDARDNRGGGYDKGLGANARALAHSGWQELIERHAPHVASWINMNGTVRPLNWGVYGQLADVTCFDPYPINFYAADHAYVRESLDYARLCGAPKPMYGCLETFGWQKGQGVPKSARGPIPAEYRQNVVQALGVGMKGLTGWVYSAGAGGWQVNEPVAREIAKLNRLIEHIEDDLLLGTPIDLARTDAGQVNTGAVGQEHWPKDRVWAGALLCGPDTLIITAANHIPASKPAPPKIDPAQNVTITVDLPPYLSAVSAQEVTEDGMKSFPCRIKGGQAFLKLDTIESGRVFVLRRGKG